jgi:hypothetical protein
VALGDQDLGVFFRDGYKVVTPDGASAMANLEWPEEVEHLSGQLTAGIYTGKPTITFATGSLVLRNEMAITVDGVAYKVSGHPWKTGDGKVSQARIAKG